MKKIDLGQTITILANVGVIAGIIFLGIELNQNTQQLALELRWQVNQRIVDNNRDLMGENPLEIFVKSITSPEDLTFDEFQAAGALAFNFLNVWEDHYFLYQADLISDDEWKDFVNDDISFTLGYKFAQAFWEDTKGYFEPDLVFYVDSLLPTIETDANYQFWQATMRRIRELE